MSTENQVQYAKSATVEKWQSLFPHLIILPVLSESEIDLANITSGIISINAQWSAPSYIHITKILDTLNRYQVKEKIYIVDIDSVSTDFIQALLGQLSNGAGETIHISGGEVKSKFTFKQTFEPFIEYLIKTFKENTPGR